MRAGRGDGRVEGERRQTYKEKERLFKKKKKSLNKIDYTLVHDGTM